MKTRFLSIILALAICMGLAAPVFATGAPSIYVTQDGAIRTATSSDDEFTYRASKNYDTGDIYVIVKDINTGKTVNEYTCNVANIPLPTAIADEDTFTGYRYTISSANPYDLWKVYRPDSAEMASTYSFVDTRFMDAYYSPDNRSFLDDFKDAVDALDNSEKDAIASCGLTLLIEFITAAGGVAAGGPIGAAAAATIAATLTQFADSQAKLAAMAEDIDECYYTYRNMWKYGDWFLLEE